MVSEGRGATRWWRVGPVWSGGLPGRPDGPVAGTTARNARARPMAHSVSLSIATCRPFVLPKDWRVEEVADRQNPFMPGARVLTLVYIGDELETMPAGPDPLRTLGGRPIPTRQLDPPSAE